MLDYIMLSIIIKSNKIKKNKQTIKKVPTSTLNKDKVCSHCGQQLYWCMCYLNEYQ